MIQSNYFNSTLLPPLNCIIFLVPVNRIKRMIINALSYSVDYILIIYLEYEVHISIDCPCFGRLRRKCKLLFNTCYLI